MGKVVKEQLEENFQEKIFQKEDVMKVFKVDGIEHEDKANNGDQAFVIDV